MLPGQHPTVACVSPWGDGCHSGSAAGKQFPCHTSVTLRARFWQPCTCALLPGVGLVRCNLHTPLHTPLGCNLL